MEPYTMCIGRALTGTHRYEMAGDMIGNLGTCSKTVGWYAAPVHLSHAKYADLAFVVVWRLCLQQFLCGEQMSAAYGQLKSQVDDVLVCFAGPKRCLDG